MHASRKARGGFLRRTVLWLLAAGLFTAASPGRPLADSEALGLDRAIELGLKNDETLRQAAEAVAGAEGLVMQAKSNAYPQLSLAGQYGRNILRPSFFLPAEFFGGGTGSVAVKIGEDNDFNGAATVSQILWAAGRVSAGLQAAKEYLSTYRCRETATADYVRYSVKEAYYGALLAAALLDIEEKASAAAAEAARVAHVGFDQGVVSKFDLLRADVELSNRESPLIKARNDRDRALMTLKRRCGLDAAAEIVLSDTLSAAPAPAGLDTMLATMRSGSTEIKALEHAVGVQQQFFRIAKSNRYPVLNLTGSYAVQTQWSNDLAPSSDLIAKSAAIQIGFEIPIFDGFSAKGQMTKAKADIRSAEIELERVTRDKDLAVRQSYLTLQDAIAAQQGRLESVTLAEEAYRLAVVRLSNGIATPLERLDAELAMTTARAQLAQALYASRMAETYLELSVGSSGFSAIAAQR